MITTFALNTLDGIGLKVPQSIQPSGLYCSRGDHPFLNPKSTNMLEHQTQQWQDNDFERRYWQKIHNLNRKESPRATPDKTPVGQYVLHLVELLNVDENGR